MSAIEPRDCGGMGLSWGEPVASRRLAVVFVHGWTGDVLGTWTHRPSFLRRSVQRLGRIFGRKASSTSLFDLLLARQPDLGFELYSLRHEAGFSHLEIQRVTDQLLTFLKLYVQADSVVFVAHSLGGLACRGAVLKLLEVAPAPGQKEIRGILLYGSPNSGTHLARLAGLFSRSARQMAPFSDYLTEVNRGWAVRVINGGDPSLPLSERARLICWNVIGTRDRVVPPGSAAGLVHMGDVYTVPKDHMGLPKAKGESDESFQILVLFLSHVRQQEPRQHWLAVLDRIFEAQRKAVERRGWIEEEEEHITLGAEAEGLLPCTVHQVRRGGVARAVIRLAVQVEGLQAAPMETDYVQVLGEGLLSEEKFAEIAGGVEIPTKFLEIDALRVAQRGRVFDYAREKLERGVGWTVMTFRAQDGLQEGEVYDQLDLRLKTFVAAGSGWYFYYLPRTVLKRLVVDLRAPFHLSCHAKPAQGAKIDGIPQAGGGWLSQVSYTDAVAAGGQVYWIFKK